MPFFPGLLAMPTVLFDLVLSLAPEQGRRVRGPDRIAAVLPMYNEQAGARRAIASLLAQTEPPDRVVVSVNGGSDRTDEVVRETLRDHGYRADPSFERRTGCWLERWHREPEDAAAAVPGPPVTVVSYDAPQAKSDSVNRAVAWGLADAERILVLDGDTVLDPGFVAALRDGFYRLVRRRDEPGGYELHDLALQTGTVVSMAPPGAPWTQRLISAGRTAEYALSCTLREGQARAVGHGALLGRSRLYTVVGCGFVARRDLFPMPIDTPTEDHDFTLAVQNRPEQREPLEPEGLARGGWTVRDADGERPLETLIDPGQPVLLRRLSDARFVPQARMHTEDPAGPAALARQLERWNGGGLDNAFKRLLDRTRLRPAVAYTVWSSLVEDLLGLLLLALLPLLVALNLVDPGRGLPLRGLLLWVVFDASLSWLLLSYGLARGERLDGRTRPVAALRGGLRGLKLVLPFLLLRTLSPFTFVAAATAVLPGRLRKHRERRNGARPTAGVRWERPSARGRSRTLPTMMAMALLAGVSMLAVARVAAPEPYVDRDLHRAMQVSLPVSMDLHDTLPPTQVPARELEPAPGSGAQPLPPGPRPPVGAGPPLSNRCPVDVPLLTFGSDQPYRPLGRGELLILARLAPLLPLIEQAAQRYEVSLELLLKVLLNESYLDPLAIGPTGDKGLSQMTSDSLTLLRTVSQRPDPVLFNPALTAPGFNVFDPDFSVCAGAAKLAWAAGRPGADGHAAAYALYINPMNGLDDGRPVPSLVEPVEAMLRLETLVATLGAVYTQARLDPARLSTTERRLVGVSRLVRSGQLDLAAAYLRSRMLVQREQLDDLAMYQRLFDLLFVVEASLPVPTRSASRSR